MAAVLAAALPGFVSAQEEAELPTQQTIAEDLFGAANRYIEAEDYEAARRTLEAALDLKPGHAGILRGLFITARRDDRPDDALYALERMADAGISFDPGAGSGWLREANAMRFAEVSARLEANAQPAGEAERFAVINAPDALIEGVAKDIETDRLFLSSVAQRQILMLEPFARDEPIVFADREDGLMSVFGIAVDDRTRVVWAATGVVPQTPLDEGEEEATALLAFDLMTGELFRRYEIEGAQQIADFVVRDGIVYASDTRAPRIYVLNSVSSDLEVLVEDPRFVNLQGLALARGALYAADYATGIWRIDLGDGSVSLVRAGSESLIGIDGLLNTRDGRLIAVRNGTPPHQLMAIDLDREGRAVASTEVLLRGHPDMGENTEPTLVDLADGRAWLVANAAWPLFPEDGSEPEAERPATIILELDLN